MRSDNGGCFRSDAYTRWAWQAGIGLRYIRPGHPVENVFVERLHWTVRSEVTDGEVFRSISELQASLDRWRKEYNITHPHQSLRGLSPLQFRLVHGS